MHAPYTLFEVSWEVCNKVGGIHTVLSTKAKTLTGKLGDEYVCIGPWLLSGGQAPQAFEEESGFGEFCERCRALGVPVRVGRWKIPGRPLTILIEFSRPVRHEGRDPGRAVGALPGRLAQRRLGLHRAAALRPRCGTGDRAVARRARRAAPRPGRGAVPRVDDGHRAPVPEAARALDRHGLHHARDDARALDLLGRQVACGRPGRPQPRGGGRAAEHQGQALDGERLRARGGRVHHRQQHHRRRGRAVLPPPRGAAPAQRHRPRRDRRAGRQRPCARGRGAPARSRAALPGRGQRRTRRSCASRAATSSTTRASTSCSMR